LRTQVAIETLQHYDSSVLVRCFVCDVFSRFSSNIPFAPLFGGRNYSPFAKKGKPHRAGFPEKMTPCVPVAGGWALKANVMLLFLPQNRRITTISNHKREPGMTEKQDMLGSIFKMQAELNDYVFSKNNLNDDTGKPLMMATIFDAVNNGALKVNDLPNQWLKNYGKAMREEVIEYEEELLWKWWSKDEIDLQNIRVELIDILHFLVSAMICSGLTPEKVYDVYQQKHAVNLKRQDTNYSKATKTEEDNRSIG